jgi:GT2 family glycosyltransferase
VWLDFFPVNRLANTRVNGRLWCDWPRQIDHPLGACMLVRRTAWDDVGPLDEGYFMYLEEVDWCQRARARGWQIWYEPRALAIHHAGAATRQQPNAMFAQLWRSRLRYYQRFHGPGYNRLVRLVVRLGLRAAARRSSGSRAVLDPVRALTR